MCNRKTGLREKAGRWQFHRGQSLDGPAGPAYPPVRTRGRTCRTCAAPCHVPAPQALGGRGNMTDTSSATHALVPIYHPPFPPLGVLLWAPKIPSNWAITRTPLIPRHLVLHPCLCPKHSGDKQGWFSLCLSHKLHGGAQAPPCFFPQSHPIMQCPQLANAHSPFRAPLFQETSQPSS